MIISNIVSANTSFQIGVNDLEKNNHPLLMMWFKFSFQSFLKLSILKVSHIKNNNRGIKLYSETIIKFTADNLTTYYFWELGRFYH